MFKAVIGLVIMLIACETTISAYGANREKYNFNPQWLLHIGDVKDAKNVKFDDAGWKRVTLPHAFNEDEAFKVGIKDMTDTIAWYRKHFRLPAGVKGRKVFIEFEGVRQGADFYLNGKHVGLHENGVMAVGFDITPYIKDGENVIAVRTDNSWHYKERATHSSFQWNDRNFNANYGGIPKNVWLHITDKLYQTLPLYSNLQTTGVYVYATDFNIKEHRAVINAESEVKNEYGKAMTVAYEVEVVDRDGKSIKIFRGDGRIIQPGQMATLTAKATVRGLHFWSWGYGYLYDVKTRLIINGKKVVDEVTTRTGFRKTKFGDGKIWLNDRVIHMKGYAQRTSNEWPGVGLSVPAWMSDYSNALMVESNANLCRWMHVAPWKQDVESCDRVGIMQMMPAGDAEKDINGRRWELRTLLMRDAIIYNRNNPSILFYESGNKAVSREHLLEMKTIRDKYDPHGGRALGSREMLDIRESEYGGEMLYVNKSEHSPMIQTEYCRDEGLRKYWDEYSYPFHREGDGPLYKGQPATSYNHNQDRLAIEFVKRWYDFWRERPGSGTRVNSGGTKIIFSDTQTHGRSAMNYRLSGVVDPLRIPKDGFFVHQAIWDGWVDPERHHTYIIGHWNYQPSTVKPVYVVSTGEKVELFVNGKSKGFGERSDNFLFTFDNVQWENGKVEAVAYDENGRELSRAEKHTVGEPKKLKLTLMQGPKGTYADGADIAIVQVEVVDDNNERCPLANDMISFDLQGEAEWLGGVGQGKDNYVRATTLPVECGVTRVLLRSTPRSGNVTLKAMAKGINVEKVSYTTLPVDVKDGLSSYFPSQDLQGRLTRGETPETPSYVDRKLTVRIDSVVAGVNNDMAKNCYDDNEMSEWRNDGKLSTAWITFKLERKTLVDDVCLKLTGWRQRSYPIEIYAGNKLVWSGDTPRSLGYVHLMIDSPVLSDKFTIRLKGATHDADAFGEIVEVAAAKAGELDMLGEKPGSKVRNELRIVEVDFLESIRK